MCRWKRRHNSHIIFQRLLEVICVEDVTEFTAPPYQSPKATNAMMRKGLKELMFLTNVRTMDISHSLLWRRRMSQHMMEEVQTPRHLVIAATNSSTKTKTPVS